MPGSDIHKREERSDHHTRVCQLAVCWSGAERAVSQAATVIAGEHDVSVDEDRQTKAHHNWEWQGVASRQSGLQRSTGATLQPGYPPLAMLAPLGRRYTPDLGSIGGAAGASPPLGFSFTVRTASRCSNYCDKSRSSQQHISYPAIYQAARSLVPFVCRLSRRIMWTR